MELLIYEEKTKYMVVMRVNRLNNNRTLKIENYCFEKIEISNI